MSDCANGGRNVYEPTCIIRIEFEGEDRHWAYPLALNGRRISRVSIDDEPYAPTGWIPVDEALPEDGEMVLVSCETKKGVKTVNRAYHSRNCWHGSGSMSGVRAWMPLPEPYGEE